MSIKSFHKHSKFFLVLVLLVTISWAYYGQYKKNKLYKEALQVLSNDIPSAEPPPTLEFFEEQPPAPYSLSNDSSILASLESLQFEVESLNSKSQVDLWWDRLMQLLNTLMPLSLAVVPLLIERYRIQEKNPETVKN